MSRTRTARLGRRARALVVGASIAVGALFAGAGTAQAEQYVGWHDFVRTDCNGFTTSPTYAPSGQDRIRLVEQCWGTGVPADRIEIVLSTASTITWRKGIEVDRSTGCAWFGCGWQFISGMYLQDADHGPVRRQILVSDLYRWGTYSRLRLGKAKTFGIYTSMYDLRFDAAHAVGGRRYSFTWLRDS